MNKTLLTGILGASIALGGCGSKTYYIVLPEQTTDSASIGSQTATQSNGYSSELAANWDMDTQFPAMFKYLGCKSFSNGEYEPVCLEIRKLVQACIDYNTEHGVGSGVNPQLDKTCSNMVTVDWISVLQQSQL